MKTRYRQMLNKLVCHIILYTFLWVTFAPGFAFAAGTPPSSSGKDKKKAVTKSNLPRNPQEAKKMYAAKEEQRIKKEQARHRAASEALAKKTAAKQHPPVFQPLSTEVDRLQAGATCKPELTEVNSQSEKDRRSPHPPYAHLYSLLSSPM